MILWPPYISMEGVVMQWNPCSKSNMYIYTTCICAARDLAAVYGGNVYKGIPYKYSCLCWTLHFSVIGML